MADQQLSYTSAPDRAADSYSLLPVSLIDAYRPVINARGATMSREQVLSNWYATFTELRLAGIALMEWLAFHKR